MRRATRRWLLGAGAVVAVLVLAAMAVGVTVIWAGRSNPEARGNVAVVLGAAAWNGRPSPVFAERIHHAIGLYERGQVGAILFTGGVGDGDRISEGEVARDYALARGVPAEAVLVETASRSTLENLSGARALMEGAGLKSAVIVSDPYHLARAAAIARRLGLTFVCSPTETSRFSGFRAKTRMLARESYFLARFWLTGR